MGPAPSSSSGSSSSSNSSSQPAAPAAAAPIVGNGKPSVGFQSISKAGNISVSIGQNNGSDTVITFPDGSKVSTANPNPPDPPPTVTGFGGTGQTGYSIITLFSISIK